MEEKSNWSPSGRLKVWKNNMENWKTEIIRSRRKTLSIQIRPDGTLLVRAPLRMTNVAIQQFLREKSAWIQSHMEKVERANAEGEASPLSKADLQELGRQALSDLPERVRYYAERMGVTYGRITIRNQRTRWGSCSSAGNLNFNCLLMLTPEAVRDYVVVHELAHRRHMDHSAAFWQEVGAILPDYRVQVKWLKENGGILMARMEKGSE